MTLVLIINCLILLFGTQGRPWSLKPPPLFFPRIRIVGYKRDFVPGRAL